MSGQWWESNPIVGPFANIAEANAWAAANPSSLFLGLLATSNGQQISWGAAGWGAPPGAWVYVGATLPALGSYIGQLIQVDNSAVPSGRSILRWNGTIWAPPRGEPIAVKWRTAAAPIANVTPGVTTLTEIYGASAGSPIIPDYMLPDGLVFEASGWIAAYNTAGVSGCVVGIGISGSIMTGNNESYYPHGSATTPAPTGLGAPYNTRGRGMVSGGLFKGASGNGNGGGIMHNAHGTVVAGATRVWAMAKPSGVADRIQLDGYSFVSEGNL